MTGWKHFPFLAAGIAILGTSGAIADPAPADQPEMAASTPLQAFQLGYALQRFGLLGQMYQHGVTALSGLTGDAAQLDKAVATVDSQGKPFRLRERDAAMAAGDTMRLLQTPPSPAAWSNGAIRLLGTDPRRAPETSHDDPPAIQSIMRIVDETDALDQNLQAQLPTVIASIKLRGGSPALWAFNVGRLAADLDFAHADSGDTTVVIQPDFVKHLISAAPADTSPVVVDALISLVPDATALPALTGQAGNLASLTPDKRPKPTQVTLQTAQQTLLATYGSSALHERLTAPLTEP